MLRISQGEKTGDAVTLRLEGGIVGPWVAELNHACKTILDQHSALVLDLKDVAFADAQGVEALKTLKRLNVVISHCSPFMAEQLKTL